MAKKENKIRINEQISQKGRISEVRIVGTENDGIYSVNEALNMARNEETDLIEISFSDMPICKIMDFGKYQYDKKKKAKEQEKANRKNKTEVKEVRFGPNTEKHDLEFKKRHIENFIKEGNKVKTFVFFKGRQLQFKENGERILLELASELSDICKADSLPKLEGNKLIMVLSPKK